MAGSVEDFLTTVLRSGLLTRSQLQDALRTLPEKERDNPQQLADSLVKNGKLSRFQAHKLLKGASLGLQLGPFQIQTPIGRGGMGTVYLALDTRNQQHVAVKVLPPSLANKKGHYLARFQREMDLSMKITHPNLAHTNEVGVYKGVYFIAMEYIPGMSLHRLVTKEGPLPVARTARLFAEVATALEHAHSMNLIHRDMKPSNIMITPNDHAKVLDLGLAVFEGEGGEPIEVIGGRGYMVGSFDYMAPEQTQNSLTVDARADLYALGCSIYFTLTGRAPFPSGGKKEKVHAHRYLDPVPIAELNAAVPEKFARLVDRLMAKNPGRRIQSARALQQELLPWCQEETSRPMDPRDERSIEEAVRALADAPASDTYDEDPILPMEGSSTSELDEKRTRRELWWLVGGLMAFWSFLVMLLIAIRVLR